MDKAVAFARPSVPDDGVAAPVEVQSVLSLSGVGESGEKRPMAGANLVNLARGIRIVDPDSGLQGKGSRREFVAACKEMEMDLADILARSAVHQNQEPRFREPEPVDCLAREQFDLSRYLLSLHIREVHHRRNGQLRHEKDMERHEPGHRMMKREYVRSFRHSPHWKRSAGMRKREAYEEACQS